MAEEVGGQLHGAFVSDLLVWMTAQRLLSVGDSVSSVSQVSLAQPTLKVSKKLHKLITVWFFYGCEKIYNDSLNNFLKKMQCECWKLNGLSWTAVIIELFKEHVEAVEIY